MSLNIRKPETLSAHLNAVEVLTMETAKETLERVENSVCINGVTVSFTVTPSVREGQFYRLFRVDGKKVAKSTVPQLVLSRRVKTC